MMLKIAQVAARLNCSLSTVYSLIAGKKLEYYRCPGIRVSEDQLLRYLKLGKQGGKVRRPVPQRRRTLLKHIRLA